MEQGVHHVTLPDPLPTLQELAQTLQCLGAEHERQLQVLRAKVELLTERNREVSSEDQTKLEEDVVQPVTLPGAPEQLAPVSPTAGEEDNNTSGLYGASLRQAALRSVRGYHSEGAGLNHQSSWRPEVNFALADGHSSDMTPRPSVAHSDQESIKMYSKERGESSFELHEFFTSNKMRVFRTGKSFHSDSMEDVQELAMATQDLRDKDAEVKIAGAKLDRRFTMNLKRNSRQQIFFGRERKIDAQETKWWIAHPGNRRNVMWDIAGAVFVLYDCFMIPLRVFDLPDSPFTDLVEWLSLAYWTVNIPMTLTVGYIEDGRAVMDPMRILLHYFKTWCIVDMLVLPFDWSFFFIALDTTRSVHPSGEAVKMVRVIRLIRTARLLRLLKLKWILEAIDDALESEMAGIWVKILKMVMLLLAINHLIACAWYAISVDNEEEQTWLKAGFFVGSDWGYLYTTCFHWSITQFTPASMSVQPENFRERIFTVAIVVFALVGFSYVVGSITGSLTQLRSMSEYAEKEFWKLRLFLKRHKVPMPLALRIKKFVEYEFYKQQKVLPLEGVAMLKLLSEQMMSELQACINIPHMTVHPLFDAMMSKTSLIMQRICNMALGHKQLAPGDILFMTGETDECMYFLALGRLWYKRHTEDEAIHNGEWVDPDEDWISEPGLWLKAWEHLGSATATRASSVIRLVSSGLFEVIKVSPPSAFEFMRAYATRFVEWLVERSPEELSDVLQGEQHSDSIRRLIPGMENSAPAAEPKVEKTSLRRSISLASGRLFSSSMK